MAAISLELVDSAWVGDAGGSLIRDFVLSPCRNDFALWMGHPAKNRGFQPLDG
jgi:hypothetical protein